MVLRTTVGYMVLKLWIVNKQKKKLEKEFKEEGESQDTQRECESLECQEREIIDVTSKMKCSLKQESRRLICLIKKLSKQPITVIKKNASDKNNQHSLNFPRLLFCDF